MKHHITPVIEFYDKENRLIEQKLRYDMDCITTIYAVNIEGIRREFHMEIMYYIENQHIYHEFFVGREI